MTRNIFKYYSLLLKNQSITGIQSMAAIGNTLVNHLTEKRQIVFSSKHDLPFLNRHLISAHSLNIYKAGLPILQSKTKHIVIKRNLFWFSEGSTWLTNTEEQISLSKFNQAEF